MLGRERAKCSSLLPRLRSELLALVFTFDQSDRGASLVLRDPGLIAATCQVSCQW